MTFFLRALLLICALSTASYPQTPMDVQPIKELRRTGSLGTRAYGPTEKEAPYYQKLDESGKVTGSSFSSKPFSIHKKKGKYVSWFGVVRGVLDTKADGTMKLLLEQKYFDGMTDCHIQLVSVAGGGDFQATLGPIDGIIPPLSLVRVYGKVVEEKNDVPRVEIEYLRLWPWLTFTFTDMGPEDKGNPEWAKYCRVCKNGRIYNPYPDQSYYLNILGDPKDFGTVPQAH